MPTISYNGQSFSIDGRRLWVLGASIQYARVPSALWSQRIAAIRQAGFNTIETACPWLLHEPRKGRYVFEGDANLRQFIQLCAGAGLRVILRAGPYVGAGFDGGGLPGWLIESPGIRLRESDPQFLEHATRYFRRLLSEIAGLQVTDGGPIFLVQSEHAWTCANEAQAAGYLHDITRIIRESGISVPIINSNDLWQDSPETIDTWRGYNDLLMHLRQLRTVQPTAPRLVSAFEAADYLIWGADGDAGKRGNGKSARPAKTASATLRRLAEILASGAQPVVSPFHAGTNFDFLGGRLAGGQDKFIATAVAVDPPLGQAGTRCEKYHAMRRLVTFVNNFSHVFAELDPDYQPIALDPEAIENSHSKSKPQPCEPTGAAVVPLRGPQGQIVFVFAAPTAEPNSGTMLVLEDGLRLPVQFGDQPVGWFALDVDLQGVARLDYSNICPWAMIDRSIVVFQGPARAPVYISISGTPLEVNVPNDDAKPLVVEHKGLTIVICNQQQIDATYHDDSAVYVGVAGLDETGAPIRDPGRAKAFVIRKSSGLQPLAFDRETSAAGNSSKSSGKRPSAGQQIAVQGWESAPTAAYVTGDSPRFASLEGPETLSACGTPWGYGWYRVAFSASGKKLCHLPQAADRLHLFLNGERERLFGVGAGASPQPFDLKLGAGEHTLVALVDNFGRFSEGNDLGQLKGLWGHAYAVKPLKSIKPKVQDATPVDPFTLRGFIAGRDAGQLSDTRQAVWTFAHTRKTPILVDVNGAACSGTFVLNDQPIAYYAGATGACLDRIMIDPKDSSALKRGKNVLRFAPDLRQSDAPQMIAAATTLYECVEALTESASWAFAKWEPPSAASYGSEKPAKGMPCWWRATFEIDEDHIHPGSPAYWLDTAGLSKGQAYINGENLGRYFTATSSGKRVGPQTRLYIPAPWLKPADANDLTLFDEHGCDPSSVRIIRAPEAV